MAYSLVWLFFMLSYFMLSEARNSCEPLQNSTSNYCYSLGYTMTTLPNRFDHRSQNEAITRLSEFEPLINVECSAKTKIFVCSLYLPMCNTVTGKAIPPCRSLCKNVKSGCVSIMNRFGYPWPDLWKCSLFPSYGNGICVSPGNTTTNTTEEPTTTTSPPATKTTTNVPSTRVTTKELRIKSKKCQKGKKTTPGRCCSFGKQLWKKSKGCSLLIHPVKRLKISKIQKKCRGENARSCLQSCCEYAKKRDEAKTRKIGVKVSKNKRRNRRKGTRKNIQRRRSGRQSNRKNKQ